MRKKEEFLARKIIGQGEVAFVRDESPLAVTVEKLFQSLSLKYYGKDLLTVLATQSDVNETVIERFLAGTLAPSPGILNKLRPILEGWNNNNKSVPLHPMPVPKEKNEQPVVVRSQDLLPRERLLKPITPSASHSTAASEESDGS